MTVYNFNGKRFVSIELMKEVTCSNIAGVLYEFVASDHKTYSIWHQTYQRGSFKPICGDYICLDEYVNDGEYKLYKKKEIENHV